jgi:hypothetical protein
MKPLRRKIVFITVTNFSMFALHSVILTEVIWLAMGSLAAFNITCYHDDLLLVVHLLILHQFFS